MFRDRPFEIAYLVFVSLVVHLLFLLLPRFNVAVLVGSYDLITHALQNKFVPTEQAARSSLFLSITYVFASSQIGFLLGFYLGIAIRSRRFRWTNAFVQHRWMLDLIPSDPMILTYVRLVLKDTFILEAGGDNQPLVIRGVIRDICFSADGTLHYLVLQNFQEEGDKTATGGRITLVPGSDAFASTMPATLFLEGKNVSFASFYKQTLRLEEIERDLAAPKPP